MGEWRVIEGDALTVLRELEAESVQTCVTSPPYFGLRDYGTDGQLGLEATPDEYVASLVEVFREVRRVLRDDGTLWLNLGDSYNAYHGNAGRAGASGIDSRPDEMRRMAPTGAGLMVPALKQKDLVGIPWAVAQALRAPYYTGTIKDERDRIWLAAMVDAEGCMFIHKRKVGQANGQGYVRKSDSYGAGLEISSTDRVIVERVMQITGRGSICEQGPEQNARRKQTLYRWNLRSNECREVIRELYPHLTAKQHEARLVLGCPSSGPDAARAHESLKTIHQGGTPDIDFAAPEPMFEGGWFLRSDIIWSKLPNPNPMPESVTDRPTKAHEYLFLLSKSPRYFYDADAVREDASSHLRQNSFRDDWGPKAEQIDRTWHEPALGGYDEPNRNKRSVWTVATAPFPGAHFAVFPPKLIEPCILAGSSDKACGVCGAPWRRVVEPAQVEPDLTQRSTAHYDTAERYGAENGGNGGFDKLAAKMRAGEHGSRTVGFEPSCDHKDGTGSSVVLDPFAGAGTTGLVATRHGRGFTGIELNPAYAELARERIRDDAPLMNYLSEAA